MSYNHFHEINENPKTNKHLAEIVESIKANGWQGPPLLVYGDNLLNGCHRATACEILDIDPEVHDMQISCTWGDDKYTDYLLNNLCDAKDAEDILRALKELRSEGLIDQMSVDIMQAEYDKD
jgi:ParB-like chromosome segregation protein Spo0J